MAPWIRHNLLTPLFLSVGMQSAIQAGRHSKDVWCPRWTRALQLGRGQDLDECLVSVQLSVLSVRGGALGFLVCSFSLGGLWVWRTGLGFCPGHDAGQK